MNTEKPIQTNNSNSALALIEQNSTKIATILPKGATASRYMAILQSEINKNPDLASCFPASLVGSLLHCARLGLEPGVMNKVFLIPFNNSKLNRKECQVIIGYEGLCDLAMRNGKISDIQAHLVYEKDHFEVQLGGESKLVHRPLIFSDRGSLIGAYAIAFYKSGRTQFEVMSREEIDKIASKSKSQYVWKDHYGEMARKTVIRRLAKHLEKTVEFSQALELENTAERDEGQQSDMILLDAGIEYEKPATAAQTDQFEAERDTVIRLLMDMSNEEVTAKFKMPLDSLIKELTTLERIRKCLMRIKSPVVAK